MKKKPTFYITLLLLALITPIFAASPPSVRYVSSSISSVVQPYGSAAGGATVYIFGSNFGTDPTAVSVFFGSYPCNLVAGTISPSIITCITTPATNPIYQYSQPLTVNVAGQSSVKCSASNCVFSYTTGNTPIVQQLIPKTVRQTDILHVFGVHRITDVGDGRSATVGQVQSLLINGKTCSLVDVIQQPSLQPSYRDFINCQVMGGNQAGEYNFVEQVSPGYANSSIRLARTSVLTGKQYQIRVAPEIVSDFSHKGGNNGQKLSLTVTAKAASPSAYSCVVAGQKCKVSQVNLINNKVIVQVPIYDPSNTDFGKLPADQNDSSSKQNTFLGSNGFKYSRYSLTGWNTLQDWATILRSGNHNLTVLQSEIIYTELSSGQVYQQTSYLEYLKGYLYIPVAGNYTFYALADDGVLVKLSKVQNNSNPTNLQTIILADSYISDNYNPFVKDDLQVSYQKTFASPGYYYAEVVSINTGGKGYFKVMMSTPSLASTAPANPTWQVDYFSIKQGSLQPEIINVTVNQVLLDTKSFSLKYLIISSPNYVESSSSITRGMSASQFTIALSALYHLSQYKPTVEVNMFDNKKIPTKNAALAVYCEYLITIMKWRDTSVYNLPYVDTTFNSMVTISKVQAHSSPISGTFKLFLGGKPLLLPSAGSYSLADIPYGVDDATLTASFNNFYKSNEIIVKHLMDVSTLDSFQIVVQYLGISQVLPISADTSSLKGGFSNRFNTNYTIQRSYQPNIPYFDPIPYQFLRTAQSDPQLYLTINKIPAVCAQCSYIFNQSLSLQATSANIVNSQLVVALNNPSSISFPLIAISVLFLGVECAINTTSSSTSNFKCDFPLTSSGNPQLPAGTGKPIIHVTDVGYADVTSIANITLTFQVSSFTPQSSAPTGLIQATITGSGFPISASSGKVQITLCGNPATSYLSIENDRIRFLIPAQGSTCTPNSSYIKINGLQANLTFSYEATLTPLVSKLSPSSFSPILKGTLVITGSNFVNSNTTRVLLYDLNQTMKYELKVLSISSTQITCILGGGRSGSYYVRVLNQNQGLSITSTASLFQYQIFIYNITPSSGSFGGGYNITITGNNFASIDSTNVMVGTAMNALCEVKFSNSTTIICTMPMIDSSYVGNTTQNITVTARIIEQSICQGNCSFTYDLAQTNNVSQLSNSIYSTGFTVTVTGSDLTNAIPYVGGVKAKIYSSNATTISIQYPAIAAGTNYLLLLTNNGYAYPPLATQTFLWLSSTIQRSNGSYGGHIIDVTGNGMTSTINDGNVYRLYCGSKIYTLPRTYASATIQTMVLPSNPNTIDTTCVLNITQGATIKLYNYTYLQTVNTLVQATLTATTTQYQYTLVTSTPNTSVQLAWAEVVDSSRSSTSSIYNLTLTAINSTAYTVAPSKGYLPCGSLRIKAHSAAYGFMIISGQIITIAMDAASGANASISYAGAAAYTITGSGFIDSQIKNNYVSVCGMRAPAVSATQTSLTISIPPLITSLTASKFGLAKTDIIQGTGFGDNTLNTNSAFDSDSSTVYNSSAQTCYIGIDFGLDAAANISTIKYMGNPQWAITATYLTGAIFQGSTNNSTWTVLFTVDSAVHSGYNTWYNDFSSNSIYRYVRFRHNATSRCQIAQLQLTGQIYSTLAVDTTKNMICPVKIILYNQTVTVAGTISYSPSATSTVLSITPKFGPTAGNTSINIQGNNFGSSISVSIDGIACTITSNNSTNIICTTGMRAIPPAEGNTFIVLSDNNNAIISCEPYFYIDRWSDQSTWGGQAIPRSGDSVLVPKGMTLLVDQSTPQLYTVIVDGGRIIFADEKDMTFDCSYFILNGGQFRAGTPSSPYKHKLTFTLYGSYFDKQLPIFGNKMIGCKNCKFNMHGQVRNPTWTDLNATVNAGQRIIKLSQPVDWLPGESIAIASTSFDHYESEEKIIESKSADNKTITVTTAFKFRHFAGIQSYGGKDFFMRAEVGLLTRNIKMQGDLTSNLTSYGSHLMLNGKTANGLDASLSYAEFTNCGQPTVVGRYCTHFHMAGEVPNSFVRGISVHNSFARLLTIHATNYLLVQKNVGYRIQGHNIFIQDGIETNNIIQDNLMISSITSFTMLQSDITVASYWVTNPFNHLLRNRAAGGDFYGFWYEIKPNPDGPSATSDICPTGMQLGLSRDNIAHSYVRFGLRIFVLNSRLYPCLPPQNQTHLDPYAANPSIESRFDNYTLWKNAEAGFLGEQLGHVTINDFKVIDSGFAGLNFYLTNYTIEDVVTNNTIVVGYSSGNAPLDLDVDYKDVRGLVTSRTDGLYINNTQFINFGKTMTVLQSCSQCDNGNLWVTGGKTTKFRNITYTNIQGSYLFWQMWRRQIFIDVDGSLTDPARSLITPSVSRKGNTSITPYRPSLIIDKHCYRISNPLWNDSIYCDQQLRAVLFANAMPAFNFAQVNLKVKLLSNPYQNLTNVNLTSVDLSDQPQIAILKHSMDIPSSWALPFAPGSYYNVHWKWGIDFDHVALAPSRLWTDQDGIVLRFNATTGSRQLYEITKWYKAAIQLPYIISSETLMDPSNCSNGDYFFDKNSSYLFVCVSGRNKTIREWTDINGIKCMYNCPVQNASLTRQNVTRLWSNTTQWPNKTLPKAMDNVTIPFQWNLILDIDTPIFNYVEIQGYLYFNQQTNNLFQAYYIWVKGKILIGSKTKPYVLNATILLHGEKDTPLLVVDQNAAGNKMMVVTGGLQFYGQTADNIWTRLTAIAPINATAITVIDTTGWAVNDSLIIGASYSNPNENEKVTITSIVGNTVYITPPLTYQHYGDASLTVQNAYGTLDTRAAVGKLNRNIRITKGPDLKGWGCQVLIYSYLEIPTGGALPQYKTGYALLDGVQFDNCAQYDTMQAGLQFGRVGIYKAVTTQSLIRRSSFHNCVGLCVYMAQSSNVTFNNNVFYNARKFLVFAYYMNNYTFTSNLLVQAHRRQELNLNGTMQADQATCYEQYVPLYNNQYVLVTQNLAQGCKGQGFVFPFGKCQTLNNYNFAGNTAGSCEIGFMLNFMDNQDCVGASGLTAYSTLIGLMANPPGTQSKVIYQNMIFTDNQRGITLRFAHQSSDNTIYVNNSYFAGYSRPTCKSCYSKTTNRYCQGGFAVRMVSTTFGGQKFPLSKANTGFDIICNQMAYDSKSFFDNVLFENYKYTNTEQPYCTNMSVFKRHSQASDQIGSAYLTKTKCNNCDQKAWAYFDPPSPSWRGWFGGCGQFDCTGPNNYLVHDQDGNFMGKPGQLLANNSLIGDYEPQCTFIPQMNGHYCQTEQLAVMQYESIAPDFNTRIMWPVYLNYDGGPWKSKTNAYREWQWLGPEPQNKRLARFWSVVKLHKTYNLTYASSPPTDSRFQIQKRMMPTGNPNDWVIIRIYYPLPNSLDVLVTNTSGSDVIVKPYPSVEGKTQNLTKHVDTCGANNFHFHNGTIEFVLNGINNCEVRISKSSFVQLSVSLSVSINDFYSNNGTTTFVSNICAFLGIDPGRLKIVSVRTGSLAVTLYIIPVPVNTSNSTSNTTTPITTQSTLNTLSSTISQGLSTQNLNLGFPVLTYGLSTYVFNSNGSLYQSSNGDTSSGNDNTKLIIILATIIPVFVLTAIFVTIAIIRKRGQVFEETNQVMSLPHSEKVMPQQYQTQQQKPIEKEIFPIEIEEFL